MISIDGAPTALLGSIVNHYIRMLHHAEHAASNARVSTSLAGLEETGG